MGSVERHLMSSEKAMGHSLTQVMEERRHAPHQVGKILALERLQAGRFAGPNGMVARLAGQGFEIAEDIAARQIGIRSINAKLIATHRHDSPVDDVNLVTGVAWTVNNLILIEMLYSRKLSYRFQFDQVKRGAKCEETPIGHADLEAELVRDIHSSCLRNGNSRNRNFPTSASVVKSFRDDPVCLRL